MGEPKLEEYVGLLELLGSDPAPDVVIAALVKGFLAPLDVRHASLHLLVGGVIRTLGTYGLSARTNLRFAALDPDVDLPVAQALRSNQVLNFLGSELLDRYPLLRAELEGQELYAMFDGTDLHTVFVPISLDGRPTAVFGFSGCAVRLDDREQLVALQGLSASLALWLRGGQPRWMSEGLDSGSAGETPLTLSDRQRSILLLVEQGRSNAEIGTSLRCSRSTVKKELQQMMFVLAVSNRTQAVGRAREIGLLTADQL
jgi:DNA-binding CsgD family transcriptional regulator